MKKQLLFERFRKIYQTYGKKLDTDSKVKQVSFIKWADKRYSKKGSKRLLDVGCGKGILLDLLKRTYNCNGLDVDKKIIASARRNTGSVNFMVSDIKNFDSPERFDIITAIDMIHGSDGRLAVKKILLHIYKHLKDGGLLIFSVPICKDMWINDTTNVVILDVKGKKWMWITHNCIKGRRFILKKEVFLVKGGTSEYESEVEVLKFKYGLLAVNNIIKIANKIGFRTSVYTEFSKARWNKDYKGEPVFVCIKRNRKSPSKL